MLIKLSKNTSQVVIKVREIIYLAAPIFLNRVELCGVWILTNVSVTHLLFMNDILASTSVDLRYTIHLKQSLDFFVTSLGWRSMENVLLHFKWM